MLPWTVSRLPLTWGLEPVDLVHNPLSLGFGDHSHVHFQLGPVGNYVGAGTTADHPWIHRGSQIQVVQLVELQDLAGQFLNGAHPFFIVHAGMSSHTVGCNQKGSHPFAGGLERAPGQAGLQY